MRRSAAVLAGVLALTWAGAPALAAPGDPVTGYWTRTSTGLPVPVQPPSPVPEGGSWVASDPSGPLAVSALRADLPAGVVAKELRLPVADSYGPPAVQACPSTDRWAPEQGGRLEGAPTADCSTPLTAELDGDVLVVPLPALADVNVLLRPAPGSVFSITFERATASSVVTQSAAEAPLTTAVPPPVAAAPPPAPLTSGALPFALPPLAPAVEAPLPAPALPEAVAPSPAPAPQAAPAPVAAPPAAARQVAAVDDRPQAVLAAALLALLGALALRLARQPATAPRALGGVARRSRPEPVGPALPAPARGVGRFRTARVGPPVQL